MNNNKILYFNFVYIILKKIYNTYYNKNKILNNKLKQFKINLPPGLNNPNIVISNVNGQY